MTLKDALKIAIVPILLAMILFAVQVIFGWLSQPSTTMVIVGIISLSLLILAVYFIIKKIYLTNE
ncbi:MAG: hypothetical protein JST62_13400 [Bacteroidetes bacterium]|jgi:hypothetical protein|nr:hypothetical protein [Bacteroidota bacterium]